MPHGGLVVVSYGHVADLCEAMMNCVGNRAAMGEIFNITGEALTVNEYIRVLAGIVGAEPNVVHVPDDMVPTFDRPACGHLFMAPFHSMLSIEKAQRLLGFKPKWDIKSGHEHTYQWFLQQGWADLAKPMQDPVWLATWDFDFEDEVVKRIRARQA